ncbi:diphosphomevalonate/mevalonate 3,5-bisphosphate decarboxylase family protein [Cochleicola gelatinilyticus]|uniref:Diphosphomevalonate decarboxylase n=1 Tax=Cochleicola gelatinilyticus TaxID=1763537 RepID=A0A167INP2_9FLAO|nr:diphosphomevalonate decarboxylase [Cochleicola gelatinilyticus]OAB79859.1 diphosphomevalonate decarboxylase [Cochleicola gelatinilyticus]
MAEHRFIIPSYEHELTAGISAYRSPSNIALVKYWGKYGEQLPKNASISFTLTNCHTNTTLTYKEKSTKGFDFQVYLDGKREESFEPKIEKFFHRITQYLPFLEKFTFKIETHNSFPHSSGIASSASGMSALALCLMKMEQQMQPEIDTEYFNEKASFLARLGSGSACRSIEGDLVVWGEHPDIDGSSNSFGKKYPYQVHEVFKEYQDTILLVDKGEKQVSSTVGHELMHDHPFAEQRFHQANENLSKLIPVLKNGNLSEFIKIVESEALSLHAMMMTSMPYFILMKPNTLEIINNIWNYRKQTGSNLCFTLDAGANVHVLYPKKEAATVSKFIENELKPFCKSGEYIEDIIGFGAQRID